jgi:hypothetical protein
MTTDPDYEDEEGPAQQFANELMSVFMRWYEESDLDDDDMANAANFVIHEFCGKNLEFEADFNLNDDEEEE